VEKEYEPSLPLVPLDESLSEQAFVNIVQNAYDAMGAGGGTLRVSVRKSQTEIRDGGRLDGVEVRMADTGPGIPLELREQIFNPFVTTKKSGVGLGLSIVSKIIDGHQGTIRIEESGNATGATGRGAHFVIFLPAAGDKIAVGESAHLVIS
jgi:nitrogen-specific signal transduction histidine kinase